MKRPDQMVHTHQTAPTQFVEANGIRFAYRRFGKSGRVPLVLNQHFTGTMDHWDPAVTNGFAKDREVILFNNAGVSTQDFFNFIQGDPSLLAGIPTLARVAAWGGGFPIKVNGEVVGAIGVSGAPMVQNDIDCARAALALLPDAVPTE